MEVGGVVVPVENLTAGIFNALGDAVGSVVNPSPRGGEPRPTGASQGRKVAKKSQGMPMAAPVVERIMMGQAATSAQKKNFHSTLMHSPHEFSARMGGRVVGGVRGVFSGAESVAVGGKDIVLGVMGCVTGVVGCLTEAVFCVGDTVLGERDTVRLGQKPVWTQQPLALDAPDAKQKGRTS